MVGPAHYDSELDRKKKSTARLGVVMASSRNDYGTIKFNSLQKAQMTRGVSSSASRAQELHGGHFSTSTYSYLNSLKAPFSLRSGVTGPKGNRMGTVMMMSAPGSNNETSKQTQLELQKNLNL